MLGVLPSSPELGSKFETGEDTDIDGVDVLPNQPSHLLLHFWGVHKLGEGECTTEAIVGRTSKAGCRQHREHYLMGVLIALSILYDCPKLEAYYCWSPTAGKCH